MDIWDSDYLPSHVTLSYAMSLYYKELIKYGEKLHKSLKVKHINLNKELNRLAQDFKEFEHFLNEKYKFMWFPVKITLDNQLIDTYSFILDKDGKMYALIVVNPHNKHLVQVDSILGPRVIDMKDCSNIETLPQEELLKVAYTEKYKNELEEYAKLYKEMTNEK